MAKKRIPEVPRDGSDADFVPENYMLIDGAEGSAKMRMDLFGKASTDEELDEAKYEKPEGGIPKTDLAEGVQGSLALADSALQASDIEGKAEKSEMSITNVPDDTTKKTIQLKDGLSQIVVVDHQDISGKAEKSEMTVSAVSGDDTKKTIQLKSGLTQNVVVEHQDISGKADTSAMSITNVSGDDTKKTIQLKTGLSQDVVVEHQDISGKAEKSEMSISAGEDDTKRIIQLKNGTSQSVVVSHQNISGKADASEMNITAVAGDETKKKIQLKSDLSQNVVIEHQDISGKAEKSEMSISAVSGDETKMKIQLKSGTSQNVVIEHQNISGKADKDEMLISAVSGDDTKKTIQLYNGLSQDVVVDVSGKADATDVLTSWQPVAAAPATGKLEFHSTRYPTRTEIVLKDATRPGGTVAEDVVVGYTVPSIELGNVGKYLMVDGQLGTSWQSVEHTLSYPSDTEGEYSTLRGVISFQTDNTPLRTSAYLAASNYEPTCLGMFVPPVKREDDGRILIVDENEGPVWRDPPRTDTEWEKLNPYTQTYGVLKFVTDFIEEETDVWVKHHTSAYIGTADASGWVGEFLPHFESADSGKILMVTPTRGPEWVNLPGLETTWQYGDSETRQGTLSVGTTLEYDSEEHSYYPHHSSAYIEYNGSSTWLGAFVPPTDIGDSGKVLMVDPSNGVEWKSPSELKNYNAGTGITIGYNDNSINVSHPLPDVTPGADKILSTDRIGNLTWMQKYSSNMVSAKLTGAEINPSSSIKYTYEYSIPLDWTAAVRSGHMIIEWSVVCANGRKNNPLIALWFHKHLAAGGGGWNSLATVPGVIMQDSLSGWVAESRATGYLMRDTFDFDKLQIDIYASNGVFTSTDEVNVELSIMYVGQYTMTD